MLAVIVQRKPLISAIFLGSLMYFLFFHVLTANTHASKISYAETDTVSKIPSKNAETYTVGKKESKNEDLQLDASLCEHGNMPFTLSSLKSELPAFLQVYERRLDAKNKGGSTLFHQFYLWCVIRALKPLHIIESGAFNGLGTWIMRQAAPEAQLIVVSPAHPGTYVDKHSNSVYLTDDKFVDFTKVRWDEMDLNKERTLVFFDCHQAGIRRIREAAARGFRHVMFDDNYGGDAGDNFSLKKTCDLQTPNLEWLDNFKRIKRPLSTDERKRLRAEFLVTADGYYEFPPIWAGDNRMMLPQKAPLLSESEYKELISPYFTTEYRNYFSSSYTYINYVHIRLNPGPPEEGARA